MARSPALAACLGLAVFAAAQPSRAETDFAVGLSFVSLATRSDLSELNEALAASGHEPIREGDLQIGMGIGGSVSRWRFGWDIGVGVTRDVRHEQSGWEGSVHQLQTFVDGGYDFFRRSGWSVAGHGGVGFAQFLIDVDRGHPLFPGSAFDPASYDRQLVQSSGLARLAIGVGWHPQLLTPRRSTDRAQVEGLLVPVELRLGYQQTFAVGDWSGPYAEGSLGGSPRVDLSGPFVMVSVGIGGGSLDFGPAKDVCGPPPAHGTWRARGLDCVPSCAVGFGDCDEDADNGCEASFDSDPEHCGRCGKACDLPNARSGCRESSCIVLTCAGGRADCDGRAGNGCETVLATSPGHCGRCGNACGDGEVCRDGVCTEIPPMEIAQ